MKIFVVNYYAPNEIVGGSEIQCWLLAKYLAKRGHQTRYLALRSQGQKRKENGEGFEVYYLTGARESLFKELVSFYKMLRKEKPDLCYIRVFNYLFLLNRICLFLKVPTVFNTSHINDCRMRTEPIKWSLNLLKTLKSIRIAGQRYLCVREMNKTQVVTINRSHQNLLKTKYGIEAETIYNSMEDHYKEHKSEKEKIVVWVNNIKGRKKPEVFIKLAECFKGEEDWRFYMIGYMHSSDYEEMIEKQIQENPRFSYLGGKTPLEVDEILAKSMIMVNTCQKEGFGNNFIQSWFNQCPTITLFFDPDNIIKNNKIGFHSGNFKQMRADLKELMDNDELRRKMGQRARQYALANHNILINVRKYEKKFEKIIKKI